MGTTIMRWAGTGSSDSTNGNVAISNPDKIITTSMGQDVTDHTNTNQAHATLTPGQSSHWHIASQFKAGSKLGKIHADATILGINGKLHIFQAGDETTNASLEIFEWCPVIGGTLRTDLKQSVSIFLQKATGALRLHHQLLGSRDANGQPNETFGGLTRAQVVADNFGIAYRVRNNHGSLTSTFVCDEVSLWAYSETAAYEMVITSNVSDETGVTVAGRAPYFLHAHLYESKFKQQEMMAAHIRWQLRTPSHTSINVTEYLRDGDTVVDKVHDLCTDVRGLTFAAPLLEAGVYSLTAYLYEGDTVVSQASILINIEAVSVLYYVDPTDGDNGNAGTSHGAAWETLAYAAAHALDNSIVYVDGGHTYGRVGTDFAQENIAIAVRSGSGTAIFENDGADNTSWGVFTGDRAFLDLRNVTVADSTGNAYNGKNFVQITGDDYCIYGARGDGTGIPGFNRYGNNSTVQARFGLIDCDLSDTPVVTYFYFIGSGSGNASLGFFAGSYCKSSTAANTNGFARLGGPAANNTDASTGFTFMWCGIDGAAGIAGGGSPWSFRLNGSLIQMFECGTTGTTIGSPEHFSPGSVYAYGNYGFLAEGCFIAPDVGGREGDVGFQTQGFCGHLRIYRGCVFDQRIDGGSFSLFNSLVTPIDVTVERNTLLTITAHPGCMIADAVAPWYTPQTSFNYNVIIGATATNGPNAHAYRDDGLAGSGYDTGTQPSHIRSMTGNVWTPDGLHASPFTVGGSAGAVSLLNTEFGGTNVVSASQETDYPEADDWAPDVTATEAQTGAALTVPAGADYRGIMRVADPSYLGATSSDTTNPDFPAIATISDLSVATDATTATPTWTATSNGFTQHIQRKILSSGTWYTIGSVSSGVGTFTDTANE